MQAFVKFTFCTLVIGNFAQGKTIEKIEVRAERIVKGSLDVSSNVHVFNADDISKLNVDSLDELIKLVPNFNMQALTGDYSYFQVRGLPRNYEQPTLNVYIDGVPHSSLYGLNIPLYNIDTVEFIKGPQGNYFGKNTRDGVILINTKQLIDDTQLNISLSQAELDHKQLKFNLDTLISDRYLSVSAGGVATQQEGTVYNSLLDNYVDPIDEYEAYAKLNFIKDELSASLIYSQLEKSNGLAPYISSERPLEDGSDLTIKLDEENSFEQQQKQWALTIGWEQDNYSVKSISSYTQTESAAQFDADFSSLPYGQYLTNINEKDAYQEITASILSEKQNWIFGLSFNNNIQKGQNKYPLLLTSVLADIERTTSLAYFDVNWQLFDHTVLQFGTRYFKEDITAITEYENPTIATPSVKTQGLHSQSDSRFLSKAALNYQLTDHQHIYFSYGEGYLSAGSSWLNESIDVTTLSRTGTGTNYQPELSSNYEFGYKADLHSLNSHFEITWFNTTVDGYQHFELSPFGISEVIEVDKVQSQGFDFIWFSYLTEQLTWQITAGKHNAHIQNCDACGSNKTGIQVNDSVPYTPTHNINNTLNFTQVISDSMLFDISFVWLHVGEMPLDFAGNYHQPSYNQYDVNLTFSYEQNWKLSLWGKNITDKRAQQFMISMPGGQLASYIKPKQLGLTLSYQF